MTFTKPERLPRQVREEIKTLERAARKVLQSKESAAKFIDSIRAAGPARSAPVPAR